MLAVEEEDEEYDYDESSEDEQQQRKSSVEEDELQLPLQEEGDMECDRGRKKGRYLIQYVFFICLLKSPFFCFLFQIFVSQPLPVLHLR